MASLKTGNWQAMGSKKLPVNVSLLVFSNILKRGFYYCHRFSLAKLGENIKLAKDGEGISIENFAFRTTAS